MIPAKGAGARVALVLTTIIPVASACAPPAPRSPGRDASLVPSVIRVGRPNGTGRVRTVPIERYVATSILAEIVPAPDDVPAARRIYEAQAIVARTYAAANRHRHASQGFDLCDSTHCQVYDEDRLASSRWRDVAREAAESTAGAILTYDGRPIQALFHADCGGQTSGADEVWAGSPLPYLTGRPDPLPVAMTHQSWRLDIDPRRLAQAIARRGGPSAGKGPLRIEILERDSAGRVIRLALVGARRVTLRGSDFRSAVNALVGPGGIRSTWFTVTGTDDGIVFEGRGHGHGVGLCQTGLTARARAGMSPRDILAFYYPGTRPMREVPARTAPDIPQLRPRRIGPARP